MASSSARHGVVTALLLIAVCLPLSVLGQPTRNPLAPEALEHGSGTDHEGWGTTPTQPILAVVLLCGLVVSVMLCAGKKNEDAHLHDSTTEMFPNPVHAPSLTAQPTVR